MTSMKDRQSVDLCFLSVDDLGLSARVVKCLRNANILYLGELVQHSIKELLRIDDLGLKALAEIRKVLKARDLHLDMRIVMDSRSRREQPIVWCRQTYHWDNLLDNRRTVNISATLQEVDEIGFDRKRSEFLASVDEAYKHFLASVQKADNRLHADDKAWS